MIKIKNWSSYQSYKDRKPPWIRLHKTLLDNYEFQIMSSDARALLPMLWLLASEDEDPRSGIIKHDTNVISFRLRIPAKTINAAIIEMESNGFIESIQPCTETVTRSLRKRTQSVTTETEGETEGETETDNILSVDTNARPRNSIPFAQIVGYLNEKSGKEFLPTTQTTKQHIRARWNEGFSVEDFKKVIDFKVDEWGTDHKMIEYLRPRTLFGTKFESYLQAARNGMKVIPGSSARKHNCADCTYNQAEKCPNLTKAGFDPAKCSAFIDYRQHR